MNFFFSARDNYALVAVIPNVLPPARRQIAMSTQTKEAAKRETKQRSAPP